MSDQKLNRREFFKRAAILGAAAAGAGSFLAACEPQQGGQQQPEGQQQGQQGQQAQQGGDELNCEDTTGLEEAQVKVRETLKYTDDSPEQGQTCDNCQYYTQPETQGSCAGCTIVPGPIHPKGWCSSWKEVA